MFGFINRTEGYGFWFLTPGKGCECGRDVVFCLSWSIDSQGGNIPEGIQTASLLCDWDEDDLIMAASFSAPSPFLSEQCCEGDLLMSNTLYLSNSQVWKLYFVSRWRETADTANIPSGYHTPKCQKVTLGLAQITVDALVCSIMVLCPMGCNLHQCENKMSQHQMWPYICQCFLNWKCHQLMQRHSSMNICKCVCLHKCSNAFMCISVNTLSYVSLQYVVLQLNCSLRLSVVQLDLHHILWFTGCLT